MPTLVKKLPRYSAKALQDTCSLFEIGSFSTMHNHKSPQYTNNDFLPPSPSGLYVASFIKDDPACEEVAKVLDKSLTRIMRTHWQPTKSGTGQLRLCVYRVKEG